MRLRQLELTNFLSHEEETLILPSEGFFFLDAPSGYGKSSLIVDAVAYALFGPRATRARQEELRHVDRPDEPMRVRAVFELPGGELLSIERGLSERGQVHAHVTDGEGTLICEGVNPTERLVRARLGGLSWQQLHSAFVARQDEIDALTQLTGAKRRELVHRLLGVRELELAVAETTDRRRRARLELERLQEQLGEKTRASVEAWIGEIEREHSEALAAVALCAGEIERLRDEHERNAARLVPLAEAEEACARARIEQLSREQLSGKLELARAALLRSEEAEAKLAGSERLAAELKEAEALLEQARAEYRRAVELASLREQEARELEALEQLAPDRLLVAAGRAPTGGETANPSTGEASTQSPERLRARIDEIDRERKRLDAQRQALATRRDELADAGTCFTCLRPFTSAEEHEHVLGELEREIDTAAGSLAELAQERERAELELPVAESALREQRDRERALVRAQEALGSTRRRLEELLESGEPGEPDTLKQAGSELKGRFDELSLHIGELSVLRRDVNPAAGELVERLAGELVELVDRSSELAVVAAAADPTEHAHLQAEQTRLRAEIARREGQLPELEQNATRLTGELARAREELVALGLKLTARDEQYRLVLRLESLTTYLDAFARRLAAEIRPSLEEMGSEMLCQVSHGRFIAMEIDDDYEISIQREEGSWLKASALSGGERIRANICLRLALTRLVSSRTGVPIQFLVLDEPLPSQDPDHVDRILGLLDSLRSFYPQMFVISHVGALRAAKEIDYVIALSAASGAQRVALYKR